MLPPDQRVVLREILRPPLDYELDLAIGTSFTLDLTSAVVVPLAFASQELSRSGDPIAVLEAVRSAASKVHLFAQAGQLKIPAQRSDLVAFLEPMVHEVSARRPGYLFHPKVWVLRFRDDVGTLAYRLVCGTRNLTEDSSWDAAIMLDGVPDGRQPQARNRPLSEFVRALPDLAIRPLDKLNLDEINQFADEIQRVTWDLPDGANALEFHALGIGAPRAAQRVDEALLGRRAVVVSPFLDDDTITWFSENVGDLQVVSRVDALEALLPETVATLECRVLNPLAGINDVETNTAPSSTPDATRQQRLGLLGGLHAKVYAVESGPKARMLIGSANATSAGLDDLNVEFLIELQGHRRHFGVDQFLGTDADFASIFDRYEPDGGRLTEPVDDAGRELERLLRRVASVPLTAHVERAGEGWIERVTSTRSIEQPDGTRVTVGLLTVEGRAVEQVVGPVEATFELTTVADITPFVCIRVSRRIGAVTIERGTIAHADLVGDPPDRLDEILARQFDTAEKFLRFVMLLLALRDGPPLKPDESKGDGGSWGWAGIAESAGLFESLVRAVADQPQAIDDLDRLVTRLQLTERGAKVLPERFADLWQSVVAARQRLEIPK